MWAKWQPGDQFTSGQVADPGRHSERRRRIGDRCARMSPDGVDDPGAAAEYASTLSATFPERQERVEG